MSNTGTSVTENEVKKRLEAAKSKIENLKRQLRNLPRDKGIENRPDANVGTLPRRNYERNLLENEIRKEKESALKDIDQLTDQAPKEVKERCNNQVDQWLHPEQIAPDHPKDLEASQIAAGRRSNERELQLEAHQVFDMINYINETRKQLLAITGKSTDALFVSTGTGKHFNNILVTLTEPLKKCCPQVRDIKQLRGSVITNWLKAHNLRRVQYMAGHRYVSSTEAYQANNMDSLIEDVNSFHPDL